MVSPIFQIKKEKSTDTEGIFIIEPLEQGYGHTLGNALRRVLLSSLAGAAITSVKIDGITHQFSTLAGMKEDIVELVLNLKKIRVRYDGDKPLKMTLDVTGPREVKAGDIEVPSPAEIINKDYVIANLSDKKSRISCELTVEKGYGYSPFEERESQALGVIPVDATFSPVVRVDYDIESTRVGRITNYDKLVMTIHTDGTIKPEDALVSSAKVLIAYFTQVVEPKKVEEKVQKEETKLSNDVLKLTVEELNLPVRITNALERAGFKDIESLLGSNKRDISKVKNLGSKSIKIIEAALKEKGVELGE